MLYYKVKTTSDQVRIKSRRKYTFLVANELYTKSQIDKYIQSGHMDMAFIRNHFIREEISKHQTYFSFGVRFKRSDNKLSSH